MNQEDISEIQIAFNEATIAVRNLENIINKHFNTPVENINISKFTKIRVPKNYIRTVEYFKNEYNLDAIISDKIRRKNISYALLQSDFHNFLINRIEVYGAVEALLLKMGIINLVSIIEALIICSLSKLHLFCALNGDNEGDIICKSQNKCGAYINKTGSLKFEKAIKLFCSQIISDNSVLLDNLLAMKDIRNNIHISLIEESEYDNADYNLKNYNLAINTLDFLKKNQLRYIQDFESRQLQKCLVILPF